MSMDMHGFGPDTLYGPIKPGSVSFTDYDP